MLVHVITLSSYLILFPKGSSHNQISTVRDGAITAAELFNPFEFTELLTFVLPRYLSPHKVATKCRAQGQYRIGIDEASPTSANENIKTTNFPGTRSWA